MKTAVSRAALGAATVAVLVNGWGRADAAPGSLAAPVAGRLNLFEDVGAGGGRYLNGGDRDTNLHNNDFDNGNGVGDETSSVPQKSW